MNKKVFVESQHLPLEQSIERIAQELASGSMLVAVKTPNPKDLQLKVASDPNGHLWVYVFSDQEELSKTFPNGSPFAEMAFIDLLATIGPDSRFGGIFINSNSDAKYLVPRELFSVVFNLIANPPDQKSA